MLLEELMTSRVRAHLLTVFFTNPDEPRYLKGLVRQLGGNNNAIRIELARLERLGLLLSIWRHGRKEYSLNKRCSVYPELRSLVLKTSGATHLLRQSLEGLGPLDRALIYGSFARGDERADSDIDLLVVGDMDPERLRRALREAEGVLGREVNEIVYDPEEFRRLSAEQGSFVQRVLAGPTIEVKGEVDADL